MEDLVEFQTLAVKRVCIFLTPLHYIYLRELSIRKFNKDISQTLLYLISKNLKYLYKIKQTHLKKTMTITYQPKTKEYQRYGIYIDPTLWAKFNHLRIYLGYSMSFIIRILIDWEMQEDTQNYRNSLIVFKPNLTDDEYLQLPSSPLHNYDWWCKVDLKDQRVFMKFIDSFY